MHWFDDSDGRAFGMMFAMQHLLGKLESKGLLSQHESTKMLDDVLQDVREHSEGLEPEEAAAAGRAVGMLYLPKR